MAHVRGGLPSLAGLLLVLHGGMKGRWVLPWSWRLRVSREGPRDRELILSAPGWTQLNTLVYYYTMNAWVQQSVPVILASIFFDCDKRRAVPEYRATSAARTACAAWFHRTAARQCTRKEETPRCLFSSVSGLLYYRCTRPVVEVVATYRTLKSPPLPRSARAAFFARFAV